MASSGCRVRSEMTVHTPTQRLRATPTADWIAAIRARFPVESHLDEVLTRKLENRAHPAEHRTDFDNLAERLGTYLRRVTGQPDLELARLARLSGGASKEQFTFDLTWRQDDGTRAKRKLILRMDPSESIVETHRLREAQLLRAMWGEVPVPEVLWVDATPASLGHPFLIAGFLEGTVQPEGGKKASGLGMYFEPRLRDGLKDQFVRHLARIHTVDWRNRDLSSYDRPEPGTVQGNAWSLGVWERVWHEDTLEAHPILEYAADWLKRNMPVVEHPVVVHGDYRSGNFMYTDDLRINAVLDWELAHIGDHHEDLSYTASEILGCPDDSGTLLVSGLLPRAEFLARYSDYSGLPVDEGKLFYFDVLNAYKMAVIAVATSLRTAHGRRTHLDAMMNLLSGFGYISISVLQRLLDDAPSAARRDLRKQFG
ncbi:MAG: phosphotransferase family protein [Porticoccaceae bacterium]|nr:MAG: phosphotransferase family protein [Porticoccaceae bacterium]